MDKQKIIEKLTSGRFILTIIVGIVFAVLAIMKVLPVDKVHDVILIVIYGYFTRSDRKSENGKP